MDDFGACVDQSALHMIMALEATANLAVDAVAEPQSVMLAVRGIRAFSDAARTYRHAPTLCAVMARVLLLWKRLFDSVARLDYPERMQDLMQIGGAWRSANAEADRVFHQCVESAYG